MTAIGLAFAAILVCGIAAFAVWVRRDNAAFRAYGRQLNERNDRIDAHYRAIEEKLRISSGTLRGTPET